MQGQFIYATSRAAGLIVNAIIRNTSRILDSSAEQSDMHIELFIFQNGKQIYQNTSYSVIKHGAFLEINEKDLPLNANHEGLIIVRCSRGSEDGYFPQEHQLNYEPIESPSKVASVVYDQLPVILSESAKPRSILLLASKVWLSSTLNTYISFANQTPFLTTTNVGWDISIFDCSGSLVKKIHLSSSENDVYILSVKDILKKTVPFSNNKEMYTLVARGEVISSVLLTFLKNELTGNIAIEHSLSPHYYMDGDFSKVRKEAFIFPGGVVI
jgi:hypothetical protein